MSSVGYRRIGLYRKNGEGRLENFLDIHFRYQQKFTTSTLVFGKDGASIEKIRASLQAQWPEDWKSMEEHGHFAPHDIAEGGVGTVKRIRGESMYQWECEMIGPILYQGSPYRNLYVRLAGSFMSDRYQWAKLEGSSDVEGLDRKPILQFPRMKWRVETRRRVSAEKAIRLRG